MECTGISQERWCSTGAVLAKHLVIMSHVHNPCGFPKCQGMEPPSSSSLPIKLWPWRAALWSTGSCLLPVCSRGGGGICATLPVCPDEALVPHGLGHACYWGGINTNLKAVRKCHTSQKFCHFRLLCKTPVSTNRLLNNGLPHAMEKATNQCWANPIRLQDLILSKTITFLVCLVRRIYWAALLVSLMFHFKSKAPHITNSGLCI